MQSLLLICTSQEGTKRGRKCELKGVELGNVAAMLSTLQVQRVQPDQSSLGGHWVELGGTGISMPLYVVPSLAS